MSELQLIPDVELDTLKHTHNRELLNQISNTQFKLWDLYNTDSPLYDDYADKGFTIGLHEFDGYESEFNEQKQKLNILLKDYIIVPTSSLNDIDDMRVLMYLLNINNIHYNVFIHILQNIRNASNNIDFIKDMTEYVGVTPEQVKISIARYLFNRYCECGLLDMDCEAVFKNDFETLSETSPQTAIYLNLIKP